MAFGFIQSKAGTGNDPVNQNFTSNVTAGSLLIAAVYWNSSTETGSVSDTVNGAWTAIGSPKTGANSLASWRGQMFYFASSGSGTPTVTATITGGSPITAGLAIHEYSHGSPLAIDGTPVYDAIKDSGTGLVTTSAVVTTVAADLLFAMCVAQTAVSSAGSGYLLRESAAFGSNGTEDDTDGGAAGSKTATFNVSANDDTILGFVAFSDAAAANMAPMGFMSGVGWMKEWVRGRSGILVPRLWTPEGASI